MDIKYKRYNVWEVHPSEEIEERGYMCKFLSLKFKNSQKKTTKQGPYLIKGKIVKKESSLFHQYKQQSLLFQKTQIIDIMMN